MLLTLALIALAAIAGLLIYAASRPDTFRVERSVRIQAPPERIHPLIDDLRRFNTWNPYEKKDPDMTRRHGDIASGPGAFYAWEGKKIGVGSLEIVSSTAPSAVTMKLDFVKPFEAHNLAEFTLRPAADAPGHTDLTWAMHGPSPFMSKLMGVIFNMDRMVGTDFEAGLADLKRQVEQA